MSGPLKKKPRTLQDLDAGDIDSPRAAANVHGVVTELSPMKNSYRSDVKYFTGKLSDGKTTPRMASFDPKLRPRLLQWYNERLPVAVNDCTIKQSHIGDSLEIQAAARHTGVDMSPRKFTLSTDPCTIDPDRAVDVHIRDLKTVAVNQCITVLCKVLVVHTPERVDSKKTWRVLTTQEYIIADATGAIRIMLWQEDIGKLKADHSYKISNAGLRMYQSVCYISVSENTEITGISEIGDVAERDSDDDEIDDGVKVITGQISVVVSCHEHSSCPICSSKMKSINAESTVLECAKCCAKMRSSRCKRSKVLK